MSAEGENQQSSNPVPEAKAFCSKCGVRLNYTSGYCTNCGALIEPPRPKEAVSESAIDKSRNWFMKRRFITKIQIVIGVVIILAVIFAGGDVKKAERQINELIFGDRYSAYVQNKTAPPNQVQTNQSQVPSPITQPSSVKVDMPTKNNVAYTGKIINGKNGYANVYAGPYNSAAIVGTIQENTTFPVRSTRDRWVFIDYNGVKGWLNSVNVMSMRAD